MNLHVFRVIPSAQGCVSALTMLLAARCAWAACVGALRERERDALGARLDALLHGQPDADKVRGGRRGLCSQKRLAYVESGLSSNWSE